MNSGVHNALLKVTNSRYERLYLLMGLSQRTL